MSVEYEMINRNIEGINKKKYVKSILGMEKKLIENRIGILTAKIERVVQNKEERDIYELLKRASETNKKEEGIRNLMNKRFNSNNYSRYKNKPGNFNFELSPVAKIKIYE